MSFWVFLICFFLCLQLLICTNRTDVYCWYTSDTDLGITLHSICVAIFPMSLVYPAVCWVFDPERKLCEPLARVFTRRMPSLLPIENVKSLKELSNTTLMLSLTAAFLSTKAVVVSSWNSAFITNQINAVLYAVTGCYLVSYWYCICRNTNITCYNGCQLQEFIFLKTSLMLFDCLQGQWMEYLYTAFIEVHYFWADVLLLF